MSVNMLRLSLMLLMFGCLHAQSMELVLVNMNNRDTLSVRSTEIDSILNDRLEGLKIRGYWDANIELSDMGGDSSRITATINPGTMAEIEHIHFSGVAKRDLGYIQKEYLLGATRIKADKQEKAEQRITNLGYRFLNETYTAKDASNAYHLTYVMKDRPEINVDALAAFNQSSGADTLAWFGHINLYVPNLDGRGKSIRLNWRRFKTNSEIITLGYEHPWLFELPLKALFRFGREVVNGGYQVIKCGIGLDWSIDWDRSLIFEYEDHQSLITHDGALLNPDWRSSRRRLLGLGYRHSYLNLATHRGIALRTALYQEINFEPSSVSRFTLRSEAELALLLKLYISQKTAFTIQNQVTATTDPSILEPLGGVNSIRGYTENFVRSPSVISLQHDLHFSLSPQSELLALFDLGMYYESNMPKHLIGYGVGVQLHSSRGPIRLILATHQGVDLRNSFLHIEYSGGVSWIDQ